MVILQLPQAVKGSPHMYKYWLCCGHAGRRTVGYDNQRPKGDHRHVDGREEPYTFKNVETVVQDSLADARPRRPQ